MGYKVLGQVCPSSTATAVLYTVPASTSTVTSTLIVTDVGNSGGNFAVSVAIDGAVDAASQYIYGSQTQGLYIDPLDTFCATIGLTLAAGDVVRVRSSANNEITFQLFGNEIVA